MQIVRIDAEACHGCAKCVEICPVDVFRLNESGKSEAPFASDCHVCHHCEDECPAGAISVFEEVRTEHRPSIYDQIGLDTPATIWSQLKAAKAS